MYFVGICDELLHHFRSTLCFSHRCVQFHGRRDSNGLRCPRLLASMLIVIWLFAQLFDFYFSACQSSSGVMVRYMAASKVALVRSSRKTSLIFFISFISVSVYKRFNRCFPSAVMAEWVSVLALPTWAKEVWSVSVDSLYRYKCELDAIRVFNSVKQ